MLEVLESIINYKIFSKKIKVTCQIYFTIGCIKPGDIQQ